MSRWSRLTLTHKGPVMVDKPTVLRTVPSMFETELIRTRENLSGDVMQAMSSTFADGNKTFRR